MNFLSSRYKLIQRSEGQVKPLLDEHVALPKGLPPAELDLDALMRASQAWQALQDALNSTGGRSMPLDPLPEWREQATVQCNRKSDEPGNFDPHGGVFMFDIVNDPCETDNVASSHQEERDRLLEKLNNYRTLLSPGQGDTKSDERGYPEYHDCLWSPWVNVTPSPYRNCHSSFLHGSSKRPHIILLLADDLGWNDVSFHGSRQIPTPNIDALAATGVILQRHYSASTCTPSRTALLASVYPAGTNVGYQAFPPASKRSLSLRVQLLPQWLKRLGYSTHIVGKWHLGYSSIEYTPTWRGFDTFFGYYNGASYYFNHTLYWKGHCGLDLWRNVRNRTRPVTNLKGVYSTDAFTEEAEQIIRNHDALKPLFLYLSYQGVHSSCDGCTAEAPRRNVEKFPYITAWNRTVLAGAVDALDESVGRLLETLQSRGMLAASVVLFASDNGAGPLATANDELPNAGNNWPLRGGKEDAWEGGLRTPAVLWSASLRDPLRRPPSQQVLHMVDWGPTLYAAAGGDVSDLGDVDGRNFWTSLTTGEGEGRAEVLLELEGQRQTSALISGRYKLVKRPGGPTDELQDRQVAPPRGQPPDDLDLDDLMRSSAAWKALQAALRASNSTSTSTSPRPNWRAEATVRCGDDNGSTDAARNFDSYDSVFVFDIVGDPCEARNLASSEPENCNI
ncbi:arylsulfatase B-like [Rhipicephalus sanguineus]|uniref:arylsulfatase B-like n=1 Tax=Rhipicephalus sanguineus TaxID=34632 RepID=UPI0020C3A50F|nr:arylsulfatase B-like [Rhipicephalus sanguineus]